MRDLSMGLTYTQLGLGKLYLCLTGFRFSLNVQGLDEYWWLSSALCHVSDAFQSRLLVQQQQN